MENWYKKAQQIGNETTITGPNMENLDWSKKELMITKLKEKYPKIFDILAAMVGLYQENFTTQTQTPNEIMQNRNTDFVDQDLQ